MIIIHNQCIRYLYIYFLIKKKSNIFKHCFKKDTREVPEDMFAQALQFGTVGHSESIWFSSLPHNQQQSLKNICPIII